MTNTQNYTSLVLVLTWRQINKHHGMHTLEHAAPSPNMQFGLDPHHNPCACRERQCSLANPTTSTTPPDQPASVLLAVGGFSMDAMLLLMPLSQVLLRTQGGVCFSCFSYCETTVV